MRIESYADIESRNLHSQTTKGCWSMVTVGRWSWKSKIAKECVKTHLPNWVTPKMDGAGVCFLLLAGMTSRVALNQGREFVEIFMKLGLSADLGGSSRYSN